MGMGRQVWAYGWLYYSGGYSGWIDTDDEWYQEYVYDPFDAITITGSTGLGGAFYCEGAQLTEVLQLRIR